MITNDGMDIEKGEHLLTVSKRTNCCSHNGNKCGDFSKIKNKKLDIYLPSDQVIPLLGICPNHSFSYCRDIGHPS